MSNQNDDSSNQRQRFNSSYNNNNNNNNYTNNPRFQQRPNTYRNKHQSTEPEYNSYRNNNNKSYQKQRNSQQDNLKNKQESQPIVKNNEQQSSRLISVCSTTSSSTTSINCICCLHELETYAYYLCQHFVCLKCAIKMRILCQKIDCPVCRQESKSVLCTKKPIELSSTDNNNKTNLINELILNCPNYSRPIKLNPIPNCAALTSSSSSEQQQYQDSLINTPNCGINFESDEIKEEYNQILSSKCDECGEWFREFDALDNHMRKKHRYFYCELCLENLKLFPYERKYYNREELAMHKRNGDKSGEFKGHPLCKY
jgi:hypothetical protein